MKSIILSLSFIPVVLSFYLWNRDGGRIAFWQTSVENRIEVPIIEGMPELGTQTQIVWEDRFVSGIETPLIGLVASTFLFLLFYFLLRKTFNF